MNNSVKNIPWVDGLRHIMIGYALKNLSYMGTYLVRGDGFPTQKQCAQFISDSLGEPVGSIIILSLFEFANKQDYDEFFKELNSP